MLEVTLMIQMDKPSSCRKSVLLNNFGMQTYYQTQRRNYFPPRPWNCRSPLNLGAKDSNMFLNFWNLNQTYYLRGETKESDFDHLLLVLQKRCLNATIVREDNGFEKHFLETPQMVEEMKELKVRGHVFSKFMDQLRLQLRYAFMALLSENCVSLFNN